MSQNKIIIKNIDVNQMFEATTNFNQEQLNTKNINNNEIIISTIDCDAEMTPPPLNDLSQIIYSVLMPIVCLLG